MYKDNSLKSLYQMKRQNNSNAFFYKKSKCSIYHLKPIDCRIFPYDVKLEKDGNYYLTDNCRIKNVDIDNLKTV